MDFHISKENFSLAELNLLTKDVVESILDNVAQAARAHWIKLAKEDKSHLKVDYLQAIQPIEVGKHTRTISLLGEIAHIIEDGSPQLDMRKTLLGPNATRVQTNKAGGKYRAIPFRHKNMAKGTPYANRIGVLNRGQLNKAVISRAKRIGKNAYKAAKELTATTTGYYKEKHKGKWMVAGVYKKQGGRLAAGYAPKLKPHHKTDIYAGMVKMSKTYEKATQNLYMTFRTISESVREGWIRKPIPARHYAEEVNTFVARMIPKALDAFVKGAMEND